MSEELSLSVSKTKASFNTIDYITGRDTLLVARPCLLFTGKLGVNQAHLALQEVSVSSKVSMACSLLLR